MVAWTWAEMALLLRLCATRDGVPARLHSGVSAALSPAHQSISERGPSLQAASLMHFPMCMLDRVSGAILSKTKTVLGCGYAWVPGALLRPISAAWEASVMARTRSGCGASPARLFCCCSGDTVLMDLRIFTSDFSKALKGNLRVPCL